MTVFSADRSSLSDAERGLVMAGLAVAAVGALTCLKTLAQIGAMPDGVPSLAWTVMAGALSFPVTAWLLRRNLGGAGVVGALRAMLFLVLAVPLSGLVAGSLLLPGHGTMFGGLAAGLTVAGTPGLALLWVVAVAGLHLTVLVWRGERDSIFRAEIRRI